MEEWHCLCYSIGNIFFYGKSITNDSQLLLNYILKKYDKQIKYYQFDNEFIHKLNAKVALNNKQKIINKLKKIFNKYCLNPINKYFIKNNKVIKINYDELKSEKTVNILNETLIHYDGLVLLFGFIGRKFTDELLKKLNPQKIFCVRLPQGVKMTVSAFSKYTKIFNFTNPLEWAPKWANLVIDTDLYRFNNISNIDYLLNNKKNKLPNNYICLGAPRFSLEWINVLDNAFANYNSKFEEMKKELKNVLILLSPIEKNVWWDELERVIDIIISYDVNVVVKHFHGRKEKIKRHADNFRLDESSPTAVLIRDADVIFYISTSAVLDAYIRGKEVLQLSYLHGNETILEKFNLGIKTNCRDDIHIYMNRFLKKGTIYDDSNDDLRQKTDSFIKKNIVKNTPTLDYVKHITETSKIYFKKGI